VLQISNFINSDGVVPDIFDAKNSANKDEILYSAGQTMRALHRLKTSGFGKLNEDGLTANDQPNWYKVINRNDAPILLRSLSTTSLFTTPPPEWTYRDNKTYQRISTKNDTELSLKLKFLNDEIGKLNLKTFIEGDPLKQKLDELKRDREICLFRRRELANLSEVLIKAGSALNKGKEILEKFNDTRVVDTDFNHANLLSEGGKIKALLDIESPISGDPLYDIAHYQFIYDDSIDLQLFYQGYGLTTEQLESPTIKEKLKLYKIRVALDLLWWSAFSKHDRTKTIKTLQKLKKIMNA
jgi:hypothetical protein